MLVARQRRGASFSRLSLASPLGAVVGGFAVGLLLKWSGYSVMFGVLAFVWAGLLVIGLLLRPPPATAPPKAMAASPAPARLVRRFG
ncbi:MAG: hypothetical protein IT318_00655 [Anaerolineales bacterium]|nr:hypothetical protein [Anaerolineales bacterium]